LNCPYAQGFRYSRPVPAREIDQLLAGGLLTVLQPHGA